MVQAVMDNMRDRRLVWSANQRFAGTASRYMRAMKEFPDSRYFEVLPLRYVVPAIHRVFLDIFSGTGHVARYLQRCFDSLTLVDSSETLLDTSHLNARKVCGDAIRVETLQALPEADMAVCMAGFHHILAENSSDGDHRSHLERKVQILQLWRKKLVSGGRLVVADVPASGARIGSHIGSLSENNSRTAAEVAPCPKEFGSEQNFGATLRCSDLGDYLHKMCSICARLGLRDPEPALFFEQVVSRFSPQGHVGDFNSPEELVWLFQEAGFENVIAFVAPTPWLFSSKEATLWFVRELLSLGQPCEKPSLLDDEETAAITAGISNYLGLVALPDESWALPWKLMFVAGDNP